MKTHKKVFIIKKDSSVNHLDEVNESIAEKIRNFILEEDSDLTGTVEKEIVVTLEMTIQS